MDPRVLRSLWPIFAAETREQLQTIGTAVLGLEQGTADQAAEQLTALKREVHSLKGSAASLGLSDIEQLVHAIEDGLARCSPGHVPPPGLVDSTLRSLSAIESALNRGDARHRGGVRAAGGARPGWLRAGERGEGEGSGALPARGAAYAGEAGSGAGPAVLSGVGGPAGSRLGGGGPQGADEGRGQRRGCERGGVPGELHPGGFRAHGGGGRRSQRGGLGHRRRARATARLPGVAGGSGPRARGGARRARGDGALGGGPAAAGHG